MGIKRCTFLSKYSLPVMLGGTRGFFSGLYSSKRQTAADIHGIATFQQTSYATLID